MPQDGSSLLHREEQSQAWARRQEEDLHLPRSHLGRFQRSQLSQQAGRDRQDQLQRAWRRNQEALGRRKSWQQIRSQDCQAGEAQVQGAVCQGLEAAMLP